MVSSHVKIKISSLCSCEDIVLNFSVERSLSPFYRFQNNKYYDTENIVNQRLYVSKFPVKLEFSDKIFFGVTKDYIFRCVIR